MKIAYVLQPCFICKQVPTIKEHHQNDGLRALYIDCPGCYTHGPFKHVLEHGYEKAAELCAQQWNSQQALIGEKTNDFREGNGMSKDGRKD